ncbi:MAG: lysophospholipid acyltransferase family protein [Myxococcota bacterium]
MVTHDRHSPTSLTADSVELLDAADPASFTYAAPSDPRWKRALIRSIEAVSGQRRLRRIYLDYRRDNDHAASFWVNAVRRLGLDIDYDKRRLAAVPATGPLVVVANHPFGVVDGIVLAWLLEQVRSDFKVLVNSVLARAEEARPYLLPIDFAVTESAKRMNLASRAAARSLLDDGGAVVVFPGGTVSTASTPSGKAFDPAWKPFTARLIARANATVVPIYFPGQNSRLFQVASLLHPALRLALFFHEARNKMDGRIEVEIGETIQASELPQGQPVASIEELRARTYALGGIDHAPVASTRD